MRLFPFTFIGAILVSILVQANQGSPELVVHLLDYLAKDYGGAVQSGKIVSQSEYDEQVEFAKIVKKSSAATRALRENADFIDGIGRLQTLIRQRGSAEEVSALARNLQRSAIRLSAIEVAPRSQPDLVLGEKLYQSHCISCHGKSGRGDGPAGAGLDPKPADFLEQELVWNSSPYKFYNTIRLGVPGTGMASFPALSDSEVWALAFYLKAIPHSQKNSAADSRADFDLREVSTLTDSEIVERLGGKSETALARVSSIRSRLGHQGSDPFATAKNLLNESYNATKSGDNERGVNLALRAYLEGIEPIEPKIKANIPGAVEKIEALMASYRSSLQEPTSLEAKKDEIINELNVVGAIFFEKKMSPSVAFGAAFTIFLREGFEAVLIIIVLLSILKAMGHPGAAVWVHVGWISAIGCGLAAWFASGVLLSMSGLSREILEGGISILAVAVLLYVGFWLHQYSEMKKWRAFLESKLKQGLTRGSYVGLAVVAFLAVFREAFEVVLFLRAIWVDLDQSGQTVAGTGVLSSFGLLMGISYGAIKGSQKLPLGILFRICSLTMIVLAIVLAGKGIHSLQEAGLVGVHALPFNLRIDIIGVYPTFQSALAQVAVILAFLAVLLIDRKPPSQGRIAE